MNSTLYVKSQKKITVQKEQFLLQSALMTAADLGAVTKPWSVHRHVSQLIAEEFWKQGKDNNYRGNIVFSNGLGLGAAKHNSFSNGLGLGGEKTECFPMIWAWVLKSRQRVF